MNNDRLAAKLKELRKAKGYTQEYVASMLGVVRQAYGHYENGRRTPDPNQIYELAKLYKISVDDLMRLVTCEQENIYYSVPEPTMSSRNLEAYVAFMNAKENQEKLRGLDQNEKEMLFYFGRLKEEDQQDFIAYARIRAGHGR